jgi:ribosomal protein S18 acetylase RimI-like enzyme
MPTQANGLFYVQEFKGNTLRHNPGINNFVRTVYYNFFDLSEYPILKHTPKEIFRILTSNNLVMFAIFKGKLMVSYLVGEIMRLNDGRMVLYICYLYVGSKYRGNKFGTTLLEMAINRAKLLQLNAVVLICDTEDVRVLDFYMMKGFMYDSYLRRYDRYDVLSLSLLAN